MPWYILILGAISLTSISTVEQRRHGVRPTSPALLGVIPQPSIASFSNATIASTAAFVLGALVRLVVIS
jgi:hypothetical protein